MITYDETKKIFHLTNGSISYLLQVEENNILSHLYFGAALPSYSGLRSYPRMDRSFSPNFETAENRLFSLDTLPQEYPTFGTGDYRNPAFHVRFEDGSSSSHLFFKDYRIIEGKPDLKGLPQSYVTDNQQAETLVITLRDAVVDLEVDLFYTLFSDLAVIARSTQVRNQSQEVLHLEKVASTSVDYVKEDFELINLSGGYSRERDLERTKIHSGTTKFESNRGASSHHHNPFLALVKPETTENFGAAYGYLLVYSGNHEAVVEKDSFDQIRLNLGISSFNFDWQLKPSETFQTPEALLVYSDAGLNGMSHTFHQVLTNHVARGEHQFSQRPILINNWEATFFDFDYPKLTSIVDRAADIGVEMFVLDDGWFGKRDSDNSSLGDWYEYPGKIQGGLANFVNEVHEKGLKFGIWVEPEMISKDSDLYRAHPDWVLHTPGRPVSKSRDQYILDFSRPEVQENIYQQLFDLFSKVTVDYVKWDMNRNMTEVYSASLGASQQGEVAHRYMLGLYSVLEKITQAFPNILFESCAGGGGRFDAGMLYYMPQIWTSDNTDPISRLKIQYGTSLAYPISAMGAHIADVPSHQTRRVAPMNIRGDVASSGLFGLELDLSKSTSEDLQTMSEKISFYKENRELIQYGDFIRMISPFDTHNEEAAWSFVAPDQSQALVYYFQVLQQPEPAFKPLKLVGLDPQADYTNGEITASGAELMNLGIFVNQVKHGDFYSVSFKFKKVED